MSLRPCTSGAPHDADWRYGEAPPADVEGQKIIVWQQGFVGLAVAVGGFWRDDRNRAPWGGGSPYGWWAPLLTTL